MLSSNSVHARGACGFPDGVRLLTAAPGFALGGGARSELMSGNRWKGPGEPSKSIYILYMEYRIYWEDHMEYRQYMEYLMEYRVENLGNTLGI